MILFPVITFSDLVFPAHVTGILEGLPVIEILEIQQVKIPIPILKCWCNIENPQLLLPTNSQHLMQGRALVNSSGAGDKKSLL